MRRVGVIIISVVIGLVWSVPVRADDDTAADRAAREILAARDEADRAAEAYFSAQSDLEDLAVAQEQLGAELAALEAEVEHLHDAVTEMAINRLTRSGMGAVGVLSGFADPRDQMQASVLLEVAHQGNADDLARYASARVELDATRDRLADTQRRAEATRDRLAGLRDAANERVVELKRLEEQRRADAEVQAALAARQAEQERLERLNAQRRESAPVRTVPRGDDHVPDPSGGSTSSSPSSTTSGSTASGSTASGSTSSGSTGSGSSGASNGSSAPTAAPTTAAPLDPGGQTGGGGSPGAGVSVDYGGVDWVCPTGDASVAYVDTWGASRSGGRRHQGVDMIGTRGTPILAVVDGTAVARPNTLGGTAVGLHGSDGNYYYYAHMDSYGQLGSVSRGTVIGYMGDTGNARYSVVHLHFEVHPGGGAAVNPYPTVRSHCR